MGKKLSIEFIKSEFAKEGYKLLTKVYENNSQSLDYICPKGHRHSISWCGWQQGQRCPFCYDRGRLSIEFIRSEFAKEGYIFLTEEYKNNRQKLEYICPRGHRHSITWSSWNSKRNPRCPFCNTIKLTIEFIRSEFTKEGYELLTEVYEGAHQKLNYICPKGCKRSITWNNWQQGKRCPCFSKYGNELTIEFIRAEFAKEGYQLLTKVYKNNLQKLKYICPRGHRHSVNWSSWNSKNKCRCPFCNNSSISKWEKEVKNFFDELNINYISNDRTQLINPNTNYKLELDLWFPQLNKAIECNGLYWHDKKEVAKNDKIKQQLCKNQGINLIVVTDKEWKNDVEKCKEKLISFIKEI